MLNSPAPSLWEQGAPSERLLVVGLGNPGPAYALTRHNVGFWAVDLLCERLGCPPFRSKGREGLRAAWTEGRHRGHRLTLLKPLEFMNLSGPPVAHAARRLGVEPPAILVIHDDIDLAAGRLRLKVGGGAGGHRGVRSVAERLGSRDFARLRIGVGRPPEGWDAADYVLAKLDPRADQTTLLVDAAERAVDALFTLIDRGLPAARQLFHTSSTQSRRETTEGVVTNG